jgi:hypothetical protein
MNPRKLSRADLADFTDNAAAAVAAGKVSGFLPAQNTSISDALADANTELKAADANIFATRAASMEAMQIGADKKALVNKLHGELKALMKGVDSPASEYDAVGFDPPDFVRTVTVPKSPSDLVALAIAVGVNELKFSGNNPTGRITYVIEAKIGDTAPYTIVGTSTAQRWRHNGVTRGEYYQYRVRAQASRGIVSNWSNTAVVYGV